MASAPCSWPRARPLRPLAILNVAEAGDHVVASPSLYGGTYNLLKYTLPKLGIETTFVEDPDDLDSWRAAVRPNTKAFFAETIANPKQDVLDIEGVAAVAHETGVPLIVDNTVATPYLIRPLEWGADVVLHSATKYLGGHGTSIGGVIVDGGTFDYAADPAGSPTTTSPTRATTASSTPGTSASAAPSAPTCRSSSRRGCSCCATSARRSRRSTPSSSPRASRR